MVEETKRLCGRRPCRGDVLVYNLNGGPSLKGELTDLGSGGARIILDSPLPSGQSVRLVFPAKTGQAQSRCRMIIGNVVYSQKEAARHVVGIAFGWNAATKESPQLIRHKSAPSLWFPFFSRKVKPRHPIPNGRG